MPSFDTVCEASVVDVRHAVDNTIREVATRFDFKGTPAAIEWKDEAIVLTGNADFQLSQIEDILRNKLTKRNVDVRFLQKGEIHKAGGDRVTLKIEVRNGIDAELAKKIQRVVKDSKKKVQAQCQDGKVRISGTKRDDLQAMIALIRQEFPDHPLGFDNFRD